MTNKQKEAFKDNNFMEFKEGRSVKMLKQSSANFN
jgi:hypothetical protein